MIEKEPDFAVCADCGGQLTLLVWGEGIDSSIECTTDDCENKEIYR